MIIKGNFISMTGGASQEGLAHSATIDISPEDLVSQMTEDERANLFACIYWKYIYKPQSPEPIPNVGLMTPPKQTFTGHDFNDCEPDCPFCAEEKKEHKCLGCGKWLPSLWLPSFCKECLSKSKPKVEELPKLKEAYSGEIEFNCVKTIVDKINEIIRLVNERER